jgi:hypothetical protein
MAGVIPSNCPATSAPLSCRPPGTSSSRRQMVSTRSTRARKSRACWFGVSSATCRALWRSTSSAARALTYSAVRAGRAAASSSSSASREISPARSAACCSSISARVGNGPPAGSCCSCWLADGPVGCCCGVGPPGDCPSPGFPLPGIIDAAASPRPRSSSASSPSARVAPRPAGCATAWLTVGPLSARVSAAARVSSYAAGSSLVTVASPCGDDPGEVPWAASASTGPSWLGACSVVEWSSDHDRTLSAGSSASARGTTAATSAKAKGPDQQPAPPPWASGLARGCRRTARLAGAAAGAGTS